MLAILLNVRIIFSYTIRILSWKRPNFIAYITIYVTLKSTYIRLFVYIYIYKINVIDVLLFSFHPVAELLGVYTMPGEDI